MAALLRFLLGDPDITREFPDAVDFKDPSSRDHDTLSSGEV
jgi:hypothetical protein